MKYLILIASFFIISSCSKTADCYEPLKGYYSLTDVSCECTPIHLIPHQQQWKFDFDKSQVDVMVFGEVESFLVLETGLYDFELIRDTIISFGLTLDLMKVGGLELSFSQYDKTIGLYDGISKGIEDFPNYIFVEN